MSANRAEPSEITGPKGTQLRVMRILTRSGVLRPARPDRNLRQLLSLARWGATVAGGYRAAAARSPHRVAVVDERRSVTYREVHRRAVRLANGLEKLGAAPGSRVAVLCRNHAWFVEAVVAAAELGADVVLVNTGLTVRATAEVLRAHEPAAIIADAEFADHVAAARLGVPFLVAWPESTGPGSGRPFEPAAHRRVATATVDDVIATAPDAKRRPPERAGRLIVLTSGTTSAPKGAYRANPPGLSAAASLISRIPLRACESVLVATPLFHMWGLAGLQISMALRNTLVLQRRFEPKAALQAIEERRCAVVFGVPVVLQRIMELPPELRDSYDASSLRVVATSGSAIPTPVVTAFMDVFGDVLYNFYGSTEVSWAAIAEPADLRIAPNTAGRPPMDSRLKVLDERGEVVPRGVTGRIFVWNTLLFEGYTSGGTKEHRSGYMATNDRGHLDSSGRLFVHGRDADMIVCAGEQLFPRDVEDLLASVKDIREAAVVGVPDADEGQRFAAYVVVRPGAEMTAPQVRGVVARYLPGNAVPRDVVFVDALPRNATGKVVVRDLPPSLAGD
ncbi:AMP-dependent synthetase and ligase [Catenulispora acidiphila DSM 44928]|uniref:AMP-dependent synthetase and ligase n=1 Tax=Catenulispora acidiphila (strain DSM 44928 / JCM 14897 / NBRC 102108 / NRRL B-24433 / ID139908) TaxID=479433 RepID=C7Q1E8_CATAD|nr:AMP-binding protein [Catenulispora acidiphila]ACU73677.1 AMP-dependent synthetase and ligase [Catenulispora acidiphila DSM 44928]